MGTAIVATAKANNLTELKNQLAKLTIGEPSYYLCQHPAEITDWKKGPIDTAEIEKYTNGRWFGNNGEIRWNKRVKGYTLLWLSAGDVPEEFDALGEWEMSASQNLFLLGGGQTKPWRDTRIPRQLDYPIDWCKSPKIQAIQYKERDSQTIQFTRYVCFVQGD